MSDADLRSKIASDLGMSEAALANRTTPELLVQHQRHVLHKTGLGLPLATVNVKEYGAIGDGVADDTVAIQNAINALSPRGGVVHLPSGTYIISSTITFINGVTLEGESTQFGGVSTNLGTCIVYTASGTSPAFNVGVIGTGFRNLQIGYNNSGFTGYLITARNGQFLSIVDCTIGGMNVASATALVTLPTFTQATFSRVSFNGAVHGVKGTDGPGTPAGGEYSEVVRFYDCSFGQSGGGVLSLSGYSICNPDRTWVMYGCNFEASSTGYPNALGYVEGFSFGEGIVFSGCWFGDIITSSPETPWIDFSGSGRNGIAVIGCNFQLESGHSAISFGNSATEQSGLTVVGNYYYGSAPNPVILGPNGKQVNISGNAYVPIGAFGAGAMLDKTFTYAVGDASGNYTTSLTGPVDIASNFSLNIAAREGDVLDIEFNCSWYSTDGVGLLLYLLINGTTKCRSFDTYRGASGSLSMSMRYQHTVTAADIVSGLVNVKPNWCASIASPIYINNNGDTKPSLSVENKRR